VGAAETVEALSSTSSEKPTSTSIVVGVAEVVASELEAPEVEQLGAADAEMLEREEEEAKQMASAASVGLATTQAARIIVRSVTLLE
jgi:hypothetical protein